MKASTLYALLAAFFQTCLTAVAVLVDFAFDDTARLVVLGGVVGFPVFTCALFCGMTRLASSSREVLDLSKIRFD